MSQEQQNSQAYPQARQSPLEVVGSSPDTSNGMVRMTALWLDQRIARCRLGNARWRWHVCQCQSMASSDLREGSRLSKLLPQPFIVVRLKWLIKDAIGFLNHQSEQFS